LRTHIAKGLKVVLFFAVGIIILLLVYQRQDKAYKAECALKGISNTDCSLIDKIMLDISNANYGWLILIMIFFMITNIIRALRWKMMFKAIGYSPSMLNLFGTVMINYLANLGVPRSGEVIRAGLLSNYEDIPLEKVLGTIFTDRIFDVIMLFIVIVLAMFFGGSEFITYLNDNIDLSSKINSFLSHPVLVISVILLSIISLWLVWKNRSKALESRVGKKIRSLFVGFISEFVGTKLTAGLFLLLSGMCCLISPFIFMIGSEYVFLFFMFFWSFVVIGDSPLFSTLVAQNVLAHHKGTALTIVTCLGFSMTIISIQIMNLLLRTLNVESTLIILSIGPFLGLYAMIKNR